MRSAVFDCFSIRCFAINALMHAPYGAGTKPANVSHVHIDGTLGGNRRCLFTVPYEDIEHVEKFGPAYRFYDLQLVRDALKMPVAIFKGLKRVGEEESLCFVSNPTARFSNTGTEIPVPPGFVFLVFVNDNRLVTNWRFELASRNNPQYPEQFDDRFNVQLWPTT
jgi:hypothetical protein